MMKIDHSALPHPDRSGLRKMSPKITISNQIQMKNKKNHSIDQNTWPVPNSASSIVSSSSRGDWCSVNVPVRGSIRLRFQRGPGLGIGFPLCVRDGGPLQIEGVDRVDDDGG